MKKILLLLTTLTALTVASAQTTQPATLMTTRGTVLLSDDLSAMATPNPWKAGKGAWQVNAGALSGAEVVADKHPATYRQDLNFQDAVIAFEFKLDGAKAISLSINGKTGHLARVVIDPKGFQARKDDGDHEGSDKAVPFNRVDTSIQTAQWYSMVVELRGTELVARLMGDPAEPVVAMNVSSGSQEMLSAAKANIGFTVSGGSASFRKLSVYTALENPSWAETKRALEAVRAR